MVLADDLDNAKNSLVIPLFSYTLQRRVFFSRFWNMVIGRFYILFAAGTLALAVTEAGANADAAAVLVVAAVPSAVICANAGTGADADAAAAATVAAIAGASGRK
ncbi:hypothetical protein KEM54_006747 [Ascosphaera aggregata]|nr:hypothetical protein KEM54_006747 [Ascosphaera aggregata]